MGKTRENVKGSWSMGTGGYWVTLKVNTTHLKEVPPIKKNLNSCKFKIMLYTDSRDILARFYSTEAN